MDADAEGAASRTEAVDSTEGPSRRPSIGSEETGSEEVPPPPPQAPRARPCPHYGIETRVVAPCCGATVCCRKCHDADPTLCGTPMDPKAVETMVCASCGGRVPHGPRCGDCGARSATYACDICKLLDNSMIPTYHCPYCNVCRRGHGLGIDFHHCMTCNMCVNLDELPTHACSTVQTDCAKCQGSLFNTSEGTRVLDCGHAVHARCVPIDAPCSQCARGAGPLVDDAKKRRPNP